MKKQKITDYSKEPRISTKYKKTLGEFTTAAAELLENIQEPLVNEEKSLLQKRNIRLDQRKKREKEKRKNSARDKNEKKLLYERQHIIPDLIHSANFERKLRKLANSGAVQVLNAIHTEQKKHLLDDIIN